MAITPLDRKIDPMSAMGSWYVQVAVPTPFDKTAHNGHELYEWDDRQQRVRVTYTYNDGSFSGKKKTIGQIGRVHPRSENGTLWQVAPSLGCCYLCCWLDYVILDFDAGSHLVCCSPSTGGMAPWMYVMTREQIVDEEFLEPLRTVAADAGWDRAKMIRVPQMQGSDAGDGSPLQDTSQPWHA